MPKNKKPEGPNFNYTPVPLLETTETGWILSTCIAFSLATEGFVTYKIQWSKTNQSSSVAYQGL